jgi:hypothetical protein
VPHIDVRNRTGYAFDAVALADEEGLPQYVPLVQARYEVAADGALRLLPQQPPPDIGGQCYGDPEVSSVRIEPQMAYRKLATDVVLLGHAHAAAMPRTQGQVGISVGPLRKVARVTGDRVLSRNLGRYVISPPAPFERLPLVYERAFGGWDRRDPDPLKHRCEPRNPVGTGFRSGSYTADDEVRLPNFEDPSQPLRAYGDTPAPVGFGFVSPNWQPRLAYAGTYDAVWSRTRRPLLPRDFDPRFYSAASPGLMAPGHLRGDEPVVVVGATPEARMAFSLPGVPPPVCVVQLRGNQRRALQTTLDTLIVDADERTVTLLWRAHIGLRNGPHDIVAVEVLPELPQ